MVRYQPARITKPWQQDPERLGFVNSVQSLDVQGAAPDLARLAGYRYVRLQAQIARADCAGALLFSPMNVRYATETVYAPGTNMHSPTRAVFVPNEGAAVLYDSATPGFFEVPEFIGEVRESPLTAYFIAGDAYADRSQSWANEIADLVKAFGGGSRRLAIDIGEPEFIVTLHQAGLVIANAEPMVERAQAGGGWFEYTIFTSGERTNPWGRECSNMPIAAGELVTVDTGMIGPFGYGADISRTYHCKPGAPTAEQKRLYQTAFENLHVNIELIRAGMSFREFAEKSWSVPGEFWVRRYNSVAHGVGMGNEWPHIPFAADWDATDKREDIFVENMVMAIESCTGRDNGGECVKLEEMVIVTNGKCQLVSTFPFEVDLLT